MAPCALKRRPLQLDPALHGRPLPLMPRVIGEMFRHVVAVQHEAVEHQREVEIGDTPFIEQRLCAWREPCIASREELVGRLARDGGERPASRAVEHDFRRALAANRHQVAAQPRLNLARPRALFSIHRVKRRAVESVVDVLSDRRRLGHRKRAVNQRRHALREEVAA